MNIFKNIDINHSRYAILSKLRNSLIVTPPIQ